MLVPTFVRAYARRVAPRAPAGRDSVGVEVWRRWQLDDHRFPLYQYQERFMVRQGSALRQLSASEREVRMGFPRGYTKELWARGLGKAKQNKARHGMAMQGLARQAKAEGKTRQDLARQGEARQS